MTSPSPSPATAVPHRPHGGMTWTRRRRGTPPPVRGIRPHVSGRNRTEADGPMSRRPYAGTRSRRPPPGTPGISGKRADMATTPKGYPYPVGTDRVMDGDNVMQSMAEKVDTALACTASGRTTVVTTGAAPSNGSTAVTFPAGRFNTTPKVVMSQASQLPAAAAEFSTPYATGVSATGFTLNVRRHDAQSCNVDWIATTVDT